MGSGAPLLPVKDVREVFSFSQEKELESAVHLPTTLVIYKEFVNAKVNISQKALNIFKKC